MNKSFEARTKLEEHIEIGDIFAGKMSCDIDFSNIDPTISAKDYDLDLSFEDIDLDIAKAFDENF